MLDWLLGVLPWLTGEDDADVETQGGGHSDPDG